MYGQIDGWIDGQMDDGWMDGWMDDSGLDNLNATNLLTKNYYNLLY